ncbi:hypothetical protein BU23DRAFT_655436 [Bimuria novae-zelandiae CBS 107.79]|uniref:LysM domain-containing protein n=1 Tax=Bimuria novae-zelandiae CBS 107.79 TaxID=1447943 RepID=A0A6A5V0T5_9PLEO|nr:hypothetical protein BU23DRAFT_655436 [Bimuria novae-zelandiae CBS 107.79]
MAHVFRKSAGCGSSLMFARSSVSTVSGAFAGSDLAKSSVADRIEAQTETVLNHNPARYAMQSCRSTEQNKSTATSDTRLGIFADLTGNISSVQTLLRTYIQGMGSCVDLHDMNEGSFAASSRVTVLASPYDYNDTHSEPSLERRALCRDVEVIFGDGCPSLATRCGISGANFEKFNSKTTNLCSTLKPKQWVCCSAGDLPDHSPQPSADGTWFTYTVQPTDCCWAIADSVGITVANIEECNKQS